MAEFKLTYNVENGGDGSAIVRFHPDIATANEAEENASEGWGESSVGQVTLRVEAGRLYYRGRDENFKPVWIEVKQ